MVGSFGVGAELGNAHMDRRKAASGMKVGNYAPYRFGTTQVDTRKCFYMANIVCVAPEREFNIGFD